MKIFCFLAVLSLFSFLAAPALASDPHLFLSPQSQTVSSAFPIEVRVDTGGKATGGVDVYLQFPKNLLKIDNVVKSNDAFPEVNSLIKNDEGKLRIAAYFPIQQAGDSYKGNNGLVATINFSPLGSGTAAVSFICNAGTTNDSNIVEKTENQDIIVCSSNVNGSYTISTGGPTLTPTPTSPPGASPTPTPTSRPGATSTPTPTMPVSGSAIETFGLIGLGILSLLTGLVLII